MGLQPEWPGGGYFVWIPAPEGYDGRTFAEQLYREFNVLVGPGEVYGPNGRGYFRLSFAAEDGRLREGLARLAAFLGRGTGEVRPPETIPQDAPAAEAPEEAAHPAFSRV
jgi:aspartate/methionine/tyrosine aminotransferase